MRIPNEKVSRRLMFAIMTLTVIAVTVAGCGTDDPLEAAGTGSGSTDAAASTEGEPTTDAGDTGGGEVADTTEEADESTPPAAAEPTAAADGEPWQVAVISSFSGPAAVLGSQAITAVDLWAEQVNAQGGIAGLTVEVTECDDGSSPDGAAQCARDLADASDVILSLGVTGSVNAVQAQAPDSVVISISPNVTPNTDTSFFQIGAPIEDTMEAFMAYAEEEGISRAGVLATTDASGEATVAPAQAAADAAGIELVVVRIEPQDVEASTQVTQLVQEDVGLVYVSYSGAGAATVLQASQTLGLEFPVMLNSASISNDFLDVIEPFRPEQLLHLSNTDALVPDLLEEPFVERAREFHAAYEAAYDQPADSLVILSKYAADAAGAVLGSGASSAKEAAEFLQSNTVESLTDVTYDPESGVNAPIGMGAAVVASTTDGEWVAP